MASVLPPRSSPPTLPVVDEAMLVVVREARRRLSLDAGDPDALFVLASWFLIQGNPSRSLRTLDRLARVDPEYPAARTVRARAYRNLGDEEAARRCEASDPPGGN